MEDAIYIVQTGQINLYLVDKVSELLKLDLRVHFKY
jgi:hypothetical protein